MGSNRRPIKCRYFGTRKGCRAGDSCPYTHDALSLETPTVRPAHPDDDIHVTLTNREDIFLSASGRDEFSSQRGQAPAHAPDQVPAPMSSQRPISRLQLESPREFQLSQIRRRFQPEERSDENATYLTFTMTPTDPDFSHAINGLECLLHIPKGYPMQGKPSLEIKNENLSAVSKAIVEERFFQLANSQISMGLLQMMNVLDRDLEDALVGKRTGPECPTDTRTLNRSQRPTDSKGDDFDPKRRSREVAQLQSRLGRDRLFSANPDGLSFTVPVRPVRPDLLPASLKQLSAVNLFVPASYPANPCQLSIAGINDEVACYVEISFDKHVRNNPGMSLISHINYLSAMMHNMIIPPTDENVGISSAAVDQLTREENELPSTSAVGSGATPVPAKPVDAQDSRQLEDRSHIHIIPRPPEWSTQYDAYNEDESEYSDDFASEASFSDDGDEGGVRIPETHQSQTGKQVLLSFPSLELHGIELLELKSVSLTLKCERCKDTCDVQNLKIGENGISVPPERVQTCGKCASYLTVGE
ncbi:hypothetical protein PRK78_003683 [Emydomyces testavorans]|uniref:C3H1-type domain-containing protein n=1 Tax=Emydomyces testavorans TaxID=2070801 RepID=A0AAF0DGP0_9EURO|nr:hypothetical protein PRK78_003683 [Emydomyces testavorans]